MLRQINCLLSLITVPALNMILRMTVFRGRQDIFYKKLPNCSLDKFKKCYCKARSIAFTQYNLLNFPKMSPPAHWATPKLKVV